MKSKRIMLFILTAITMFSMKTVYADTTDVVISNVTCKNLYDGALKDNFKATVSGLIITVDDSYFKTTGDYLNCSIEITNNSSDDVSIDSTSISSKSNEYLTYSLTQDGENIIAKNNKKIYTLDVKYIKQYTEATTLANNVEIKLSGDSIENPETGTNNVYLIASLAILGIALVLIIIFHPKKQYLYLLLLTISLSLCTSVYALTQITITLNNKIIIEVPTPHKVQYVLLNPSTYCDCGTYTFPTTGNVPVDDNEYVKGDIVTVKTSDGTIAVNGETDLFEKTWYAKEIPSSFDGIWNKLDSASIYKEGNTFVMPDEDVTLYALFEDIHNCEA